MYIVYNNSIHFNTLIIWNSNKIVYDQGLVLNLQKTAEYKVIYMHIFMYVHEIVLSLLHFLSEAHNFLILWF